jgi:hypothetical protein
MQRRHEVTNFVFGLNKVRDTKDGFAPRISYFIPLRVVSKLSCVNVTQIKTFMVIEIAFFFNKVINRYV